MIARCFSTVLALLAIAGSLPVTAQAQVPSPATEGSAQGANLLAEHLQADAPLALVTSHVGQTCAQFQKTRLGEKLCGPEFAPLIAELARRGLGGPLNLQPVFGFGWSDLAQVADGSALVVFGLPADELGTAWIFQGSVPAGQQPASLVAAGRYFAEIGYKKSTATKSGVALTLYQPPADSKKPGKVEPPRVLFVANGYYGVANSPAAADAILAVKPDKSLATAPAWNEATKSSTSDAGEFKFVVRPLELWDAVRRADAKQNPPAAPAVAPKQPVAVAKKPNTSKQPVVKNAPKAKAPPEAKPQDPLASSRQLGFDGVTALAGSVQFLGDGADDWQLKAQMLVARPFVKALRLLDMQPGSPPALPDWISAKVDGASFWRWDFSKAMQGFGNLYDEANEPGPDGVGLFEDMLDGLRDDPEGVQVDLRRDVFAHLGPEIMSVSDGGESPEEQGSLYVAKVRDVPRVTAALTRFYRDDKRVKHVRVGEYQVWTVSNTESLFVEGESDSIVSIRALAIGKDQLLFGTDVNQLNAAIADQENQSPLKSDAIWAPLWSRLLADSTDQTALWDLSRIDRRLEPPYQKAATKPKEAPQPKPATTPTKAGSKGAVKEAPAEAGDDLPTTLLRVLLFGTSEPLQDLPYDAVPAFSRVRSALAPAGMLMSQMPEGWTIELRGLRGGDSSP